MADDLTRAEGAAPWTRDPSSVLDAIEEDG